MFGKNAEFFGIGISVSACGCALSVVTLFAWLSAVDERAGGWGDAPIVLSTLPLACIWIAVIMLASNISCIALFIACDEMERLDHHVSEKELIGLWKGSDRAWKMMGLLAVVTLFLSMFFLHLVLFPTGTVLMIIAFACRKVRHAVAKHLRLRGLEPPAMMHGTMPPSP
jgi:hypothetical protein